MLKVLAASDSHGSGRWLDFARLCRDCDAAFFLGDGVEDAARIEAETGRPLLKVAGNCDRFSREAREIVVNLEGVKALAVHGDAYGVKYGLDRLVYRALEAGARLALFGHTHRPCVVREGELTLVNPGALKDGRYAEIVIGGGRIGARLLELR